MAHDSFHGTATRNGQRFMEAIIHKRFSARIMNTAIYTANRRDGSKGGPNKCNRVESRACKIFSRSIGVREIDTNFPFPFSKRFQFITLLFFDYLRFVDRLFIDVIRSRDEYSCRNKNIKGGSIEVC